MKSIRLIYLAVLYIMAFSSFLVFSTSIIPWVQFRFFSEPAILFALPEAPVNGPEDERSQAALIASQGWAVRLDLPSGGSQVTRAHLTSEHLAMARSDTGLRGLFRKKDNNSVRFVTNLNEVDSPWLWLILWLAISFVAVYARKLPLRHS